jgi:hypothetical protein
LKVDFQAPRVTSDGGLLLVRELDERLGWSVLIAKNTMDDRRGKNTPSGAVRMKIVSHYRRTAGLVYDQPRFLNQK